MSAAPLLSRHLGDYLLIAQLSEDALGVVFRALCAADERRFVRLRILRSEELPADAIEAAIRENASRGGSLAHSGIVDRQQLDLVDGIPFMTWDETSGWTLDILLSRVRAFGIRIPAEYALLIAERIAAALEHAHRTTLGGRPAHHGLLWPGFVSIAHDSAVRVGGFGLAEGVLPSLSKPRLTAEIAPYVAPEVRGGGAIGGSSDVYALGAILAELLTGRQPSLDTPPVELRAGDPRSEELGAFLYRCMASRPEERFASAIEMHREIQRMVTGNPFSLYTANLALFLYKLLSPESQLAAPASDWESTNPVVLNALATAPPQATVPESVAVVDPSVVGVGEPAVRTAEPLVEASEPIAQTAAPIADPAELVNHAAGLLDDTAETAVVPVLDSNAVPADATAGAASEAADGSEYCVLPFSPERLSRPLRVWATAWTRPASALAAAAGLTVGAFLVISQIRGDSVASAPTARQASGLTLAPVSASRRPDSSATGAPEISVVAGAPVAVVLPAATGHFETAATRPGSPLRPSKPVPAQSRQPAEDLRLRAALARIEADRLNAKEAAGDIFGEGRHSEEEGERLLHQRDYDAAQLAFSRAARLFQEAQDISWEQRLRGSSLASGQ